MDNWLLNDNDFWLINTAAYREKMTDEVRDIEIAKAQGRKIVERLERLWNDPIMEVYFRLEDWQALKEEMGLKD